MTFLSPDVEMAPNEPGVKGQGMVTVSQQDDPHPRPTISWTRARPKPKHNDVLLAADVAQRCLEFFLMTEWCKLDARS